MELALAKSLIAFQRRADEAVKLANQLSARLADRNRALTEILEGLELGLQSLPSESRQILSTCMGGAHKRARELGY